MSAAAILEHTKRPSSTKKGPGRYHREGLRKTNSARWRVGGLGEYGKTLMAAWAIARRELKAKP